MLGLVKAREPWPLKRMGKPEDFEREHRRQYAAALKAMLRDKKISIEDFADRLQQSLTSAKNYVRGERRFTDELIGKVTAAIGETPEALEAKRLELFGGGPPVALPAVGIGDGEWEFLRGPMSRTGGFRLVVTGDVGPREIGNLIDLLSAHKTVMETDD